MSQQTKLGTTATSLWVSSDGWTRVKYHDTVVIKWNKTEIILDSGGWRTVTTKLRMNQASAQFGLRIQVYQAGGYWFVRTFDSKQLANFLETLEFSDGMVIKRSLQAKRKTG